MRSVAWLWVGAFSFFSALTQAESRVIGGEVVAAPLFPEVVNLSISSSRCTGTLVGPKVVLMTAHCAQTGNRVEVNFHNYTYFGTAFRNPNFPGADLDLGVVILETAAEVKPATLAQSASFGDEVTLVGYGCTTKGGGGGNDGQLRKGTAKIIGAHNYDIVTEGAAACFGDSGGPGYVQEGDSSRVIGVMSKGNIDKTTYFARVDSEAGQEFLEQVANQFEVAICGYNSDCGNN